MLLPPLKRFDDAAAAAARAHLDRLTKPPGSLGKLEHLAAWWCGVSGYPAMVPERARLYTFAADHGVAAEGVSRYGSSVTAQMVANFLSGGAAVNVFARHHRVELTVVDVGVLGGLDAARSTADARFVSRPIRRGTGNFAREPAMSRGEAEAAVAVGIALAQEAAARGAQILGAGEIGVGGSTAAAAVLAAIAAMPAKLTAGRGTGIDDAALARKIAVIDAAIARHQPARDDGIGVLAAVGGLEIAAIAGLCIGGASVGVPVLLDGFSSTAGGLVASVLAPGAMPFVGISHRSAENAHWAMSRYLGKEPVHDLDLRVGEGTGAVLGIDSVRLASRVLGEMATFHGAGVDGVG